MSCSTCFANIDAVAFCAKDGRRNPTKRRAGPASFSLDIRPSTQEYTVCKWLGDTQCLEPGAFNHPQRCRSSRREALWHDYGVPQPCSIQVARLGCTGRQDFIVSVAA